MAINRVDYPANLTDQSDFSAHGALIETRYMDQSVKPIAVVSGNVPKGVVFQVGAVVYRADSDTAITGTASEYVRIVPDGATATAEYVASLSGVSWNSTYNGYYDASENLYVFDEGKALAAGEIAAVFGRYLAQQPNGDVAVGRNLDVEGDVAVGGDLDATGNVVVGGTINTGQGATELHPMNQAVRSTDAVTFTTVNTGQGANELHPMNQPVRSTDAVTFATVNTGQGANELYDMNQNVTTTSNVTFGFVLCDRVTADVGFFSNLFSGSIANTATVNLLANTLNQAQAQIFIVSVAGYGSAVYLADWTGGSGNATIISSMGGTFSALTGTGIVLAFDGTTATLRNATGSSKTCKVSVHG